MDWIRPYWCVSGIRHCKKAKNSFIWVISEIAVINDKSKITVIKCITDIPYQLLKTFRGLHKLESPILVSNFLMIWDSENIQDKF